MTVLEGSLGGNTVVLDESDTAGGLVVVKSPVGGASMEMEVAAHSAVSGMPGVVELVGFTADPWSIATRFVSPVRDEWTVADARCALETLGRLEGGIPAMPARVMCQHEGDTAAVHRAAEDCGGWGGRVMVAAWTALQAVPVEQCVVSHCDTRPENWVLSDSGPVLLDFGAVGWAPRGWDKALFLAHQRELSVPRKRVLARECGVPWRLVAVAGAVWWALAWDACQQDSVPVRQWGLTYEPVFRELVVSSRECWGFG